MKLAWPLLLLATGSAAAQPAVQGPCDRGGCTWFRETGREVVGASPRGLMLRLQVTWWESAHPRGRAEAATRRETLYLRCSIAAPAVVERRNGLWWERPIDPLAEAPAGPDRGVAALYAWACHGLRAGEGPGPLLSSIYPARGDAALPGPRPLHHPEDALGPPAEP